ncbi:hypothetical protein VTG60DRAFT_98 [Thermothelomyces hinnuleus]
MNPEYRAEFVTDAWADTYVQHTFGASHPDLVEIYLGLTVPILKADLLRYLLLFSEGGVYCDLDVSCDTPFGEWIPPQYKDEANVVVGWEFDVGWPGPFAHQLAIWTIMAKPGSPHLWTVIEETIQWLKDEAKKNNVSVGELTLDKIGDVVDITGPRRFTQGVLRSLGRAFRATEQDIQEILEPKLVGDVLVLPGYAFAASANHYDKEMRLPPPLVTHHYVGSWKNPKGGEAS